MRIDGHTEEQIHKHLGVGHNAWNNYKNEHEELREALKISKEGLISQLEQTLFQKALEGNPTLLIFALKNLHPKKWGEKIDVNANVTTKEFVTAMEKFVEKLRH
jgi:hypothetical protein